MRHLAPTRKATAVAASALLLGLLAGGSFQATADTAPSRAVPTAPAAPAAPAKGERVQQWSAWGGTVGVRWNRDLARDLGLHIGQASSRHAELGWYEHEVFDLRESGPLAFSVHNGNLRAFEGGALQAQGGHIIDTPGGRIDLTHFRLVPRVGSATPLLDLVSADNRAWFTIDRLMYELIDGRQRLAVRTMDLRITPELAAHIGRPEVAGWAIADMELTTQVVRQGDDPAPTGSYVPRWHGSAVPGVAGAVHEADLFMQTFSAQYSRCNGCTGEGGSGQVVFTPSSTLRNNVNYGAAAPTVAGDPLGTSSALYTADIPWYSKFSGNFPPYGNDQHPYLIWNLYRLNADGSIEQIGRSGVKHAFLTLNTTCIDDPGDSHILGRGCSDVYSVGNNDSSNALGPRSEIVPASNLWGRCGSIYDTNCDGIANTSGNGSYDQRLVVRESQFSGAAQAGATYLFESWYLARGDVNILNSMGTKRVTFTRSGSVWVVGGNDQYRLGPAIDRWVDPAQPGRGAATVMLRTPEGNVKVAGRATDLGGGRWRYDYAVMNLDFARALTQGSEPNLRVLSNLGLSRFTVPVSTSTITELGFSDGDLDPSNDWTGSVVGRNVVFSAPAGQALNWGTMFRFSFVANQGPAKGAFVLDVATPGTPQQLKSTGLVAPAPSRGIGGIGGG
jgi:hypothetical protein